MPVLYLDEMYNLGAKFVNSLFALRSKNNLAAQGNGI